MRINNEITSKRIMEEIANRIKNYRINMSITQQELSERSGISLRNIIRIEKGEDTQFLNIIKILSVFNLQENLNLILPDASESPIYQLDKEKDALRKRATKKKANRRFKWGDEI